MPRIERVTTFTLNEAERRLKAAGKFPEDKQGIGALRFLCKCRLTGCPHIGMEDPLVIVRRKQGTQTTGHVREYLFHERHLERYGDDVDVIENIPADQFPDLFLAAAHSWKEEQESRRPMSHAKIRRKRRQQQRKQTEGFALAAGWGGGGQDAPMGMRPR